VDPIDPADVAAAAAGDEVAFERLVRALQGRIWRYLVQMIGDRALAEDLAQEVFIRMHRKLHTVHDPERLLPWVFTVARNKAYDEGRSRQRRPLELLGERELAGESVDPHVEVEVSDALDRLERDLCEAVTLVGVTGLTYAEAATVLGVPVGTVKSRVFRARAELMKTLNRGRHDVR